MGPRPPEPADAKYFTIAYYNVRQIVFSSIPFDSMWRFLSQAYPESTGRVHIASATNPYEPFILEPGYLNA
jgi:hypothetical protein